MPKLHSSRRIVKVLLARNFVFITQKGSHAKFRKNGNPVLTVIVPMNKKEVPHGTFRSLLRQSCLTQEDFKEK